MTLNVTVPDTVYRQIAELAARQQVSVERIVAAALAEQLSGWTRVEQMAERQSRTFPGRARQGSGSRARPGRPALDDGPKPRRSPETRGVC